MSERTSWHPGFYGAMEYELRAYRSGLTFETEHQLNLEPLRIDLLIIEKQEGLKIENEVGAAFKRYNIIEFKSPEDRLTIDDFYKVKGYTCLYKALTGKTDAIRHGELSYTFVQEKRPVKLLRLLREYRHVTEAYPGIYYVSDEDFACQIIVTDELSEVHPSLRLLTRNAKRIDVVNLLRHSAEMDAEDLRNVDALMEVSARVNRDLFETVKEDADMCQALREIMKDELLESRQEGIMLTLRSLVEQGLLSIELAAKQAGMSESEFAAAMG